jgi:hypothetical protein
VLADWCGPKAPTLEAPKKTKEASNVCFPCIKLKKRGSALLQSYFIFSFLFFFDFADYWLLVSGSQLNPTYSKILRNALCHFLIYKTAMLKLFVDFFQASP